MTQGGAYVALFDLADKAGVVGQLPAGRARFFQVDVSSSSDLQKAVDGTVEWVQGTGAPLGGVVASAGVAAPAKVRCLWRELWEGGRDTHVNSERDKY